MSAAAEVDAAEPERITVVRWKCPHCSRSRSARKATADHIQRCWHNPANRACRSCKHFMEAEGDCGSPECNGCGTDAFCDRGVHLGEHNVVEHCVEWQPVEEVGL